MSKRCAMAGIPISFSENLLTLEARRCECVCDPRVRVLPPSFFLPSYGSFSNADKTARSSRIGENYAFQCRYSPALCFIGLRKVVYLPLRTTRLIRVHMGFFLKSASEPFSTAIFASSRSLSQGECPFCFPLFHCERHGFLCTVMGLC